MAGVQVRELCKDAVRRADFGGNGVKDNAIALIDGIPIPVLALDEMLAKARLEGISVAHPEWHPFACLICKEKYELRAKAKEASHELV